METGPDAGLLQSFATNVAVEAEQQLLLRKLQKAQKTNSELMAELDSANKKLAKLRQERKYIDD